MSANSQILVVDDDPMSQRVISQYLERNRFRVRRATDGESGLAQLAHNSIDAVIADHVMPRLDGIALLKKMKEMAIDVPFIMVTGHGSIPCAVQVMQLGAADYLTKPVNPDALIAVLQKALQEREWRREVEHLRDEVGRQDYFCNIIQKSPAMKQVCKLVADLAETDSTVLIQGETGTGKEMIAKAIHMNSTRKDRPLVGFNCAALSETLLESELFGHEKGAFTGALKTRAGRFEQANGGTVFLDEVGDIPLATQVKLLRVLQEKEFERVGGNASIKVDVRIISATNKDLPQAIRDGKFREDLFYRLNVMLIQIPPLRERLEDLPPLAFHFLREYAKRCHKEVNDIEYDAMQLLSAHRWPGNVRELQNVIERSVLLEKSHVLSGKTTASCLPLGSRQEAFSFFKDMPYHEAKDALLDRFDRDYIAGFLKKHDGNILQASKEARMGYSNFYEKMKKHGISKWEFKSN
ncbi:sigma-54 dependent transcriptional regulator [candidate division KSB1 bacterium]|nr:sigma-54 dependent transcriptional regulator [candidate division KSB1 bacterium]